MLKKLITIILQIFRCFQNPPSNFRVISPKLVDYLTDKTILTNCLGKYFENLEEMPTGCPDLNSNAKVTFCMEHDVGITGVQVREGTTRELECSKSGGGRWILPFVPLGAGATFKRRTEELANRAGFSLDKRVRWRRPRGKTLYCRENRRW